MICSIKNEKSNIVASLDQVGHKITPLASVEEIQNYLKKQLSVSDATMVGDTEWKPAATVDMEK